MENSWPKMLVESIDELFGSGSYDSEQNDSKDHDSFHGSSDTTTYDTGETITVKTECEDVDDGDNGYDDADISTDDYNGTTTTYNTVYQVSHDDELHIVEDMNQKGKPPKKTKCETNNIDINCKRRKRCICKQCGKQHPTLGSLESHRQTLKSDLQSRKNKRDGNVNPDVSSVVEYQQSICNPKSRWAGKCNFCGKSYVSKPALGAHLQTHIRAHSCDLCKKTFSNRWLLQVHLRTHTGEKPYACDQCDKAFADQSNLRVHLRTHSGVKLFKCDQCDKSFATRQNLLGHLNSGTVHIRKVTLETPFKCYVCERSYSNGYNLKVHLRVHTGEKPYECNECGKSFTDRSTIRSHIQQVHLMKRKFKCSNCSRGFSRNTHLKRHVEFACTRKKFNKIKFDRKDLSRRYDHDSLQRYEDNSNYDKSILCTEGRIVVKTENELIIE